MCVVIELEVAGFRLGGIDLGAGNRSMSRQIFNPFAIMGSSAGIGQVSCSSSSFTACILGKILLSVMTCVAVRKTLFVERIKVCLAPARTLSYTYLSTLCEYVSDFIRSMHSFIRMCNRKKQIEAYILIILKILQLQIIMMIIITMIHIYIYIYIICYICI